ncbi:MAG: hypothetical protein GY737_19280 [Desulfobacteraceae bacterium]|nr:hypothetical protein [Desulfobacteraceae bacterium]
MNLKAPDADLARDLQQEASALCRTEVRAALSKLFDGIAGSRVIRLERLEVVLAPFKDMDAFRRDFVSDVSAGIRENLEAALARSPTVMDEKKPPRPEVFPAEWKSADLFLNVIAHGSAPWTADPNGFDAAAREVPDLLLGSREFRDALKKVLQDSSNSVKRLAMQFDPGEFPRIIGAMTQLREPWILEVQQAVEKIFNKFEPGTQVRLNTRYAVIEAAFHASVDEDFFARASFRAALEKLLPARPFFAADPFAPDQQKKLSAADPFPSHLQKKISAALPFASRQEKKGSPADPFPSRQQEIFIAGAWNVAENFPGKLRHLFLNALGDFFPVHGQSAPDRFGLDTLPGDDEYGNRQAEVLKPWTFFPVDSSGPGAYQSIIDPDRPMTTEKQPSSMEPSGKDATERKTFYSPETDKKQNKKETARNPMSNGVPREDTGTRGMTVQAEHGKLEPGLGQRRESGPGEADLRRREQDQWPQWLTPPMDLFHIHNAGMVLLAPFFPSVFRDLNYVNEENQFVDDKTKIRAIHFTQFLVTGKNFPAESDLVLNKILCGLEPEEPLERFLSLDEKERDVAMDLLLSAIGHWKALKKTSAPVFRNTFLRHFGILDSRDESWRLRVERTTIDVLIDSLPWTISVIKHPWMHKPVMVEW